MKNIAIFASGSGTNAENIMNHFSESSDATVRLVLTNKQDAGVIKRAEKYNVKTVVFNREQFSGSNYVANLLRDEEIDYVVLAGFLWLVPESIINGWAGRIVNIHPALLPNYGGRGMYGMNVHNAVIEAGESKSGITIHHVNSVYDSGDTILQATVDIEPGDTPEMLAAKIHELEYEYFPKVIEQEIKNIIK